MPPLSVVVATVHPWPELEMTMESLWPQAVELGAEIIIMDGDGAGVPSDFPERYPGAESVRMPGVSVFILRAHGMRRARGAIVAITEDHCRLPAHWCRRLIEVHERHPEAAAVGGAVENGSTEKLVDWANYFIAHVPLMPPVEGGEAGIISAQAGMALKRSAVPREIPARGVMEMLYLRDLRRRGEKLILDDGIVVEHVQSHGFWRTFATHYHNGRSIAGFRRVGAGAAELAARIASTAVLPAFLMLRSTAAVLRKRRFRRQLALSLPLMAGCACCHAAGELMGYAFGHGSSPERLS